MTETSQSRKTIQDQREAHRLRVDRYAREVFGPANDEYIFLLLSGTHANEAQRRSDETYERLRKEFVQ